MFFSYKVRYSFNWVLAACLAAFYLASASPCLAQVHTSTKSAAKKPVASSAHKLTQADIQKMWGLSDDALLTNEIRLKDLAFEPEEDWVMTQLKKATGVPPEKMPRSAAELKSRIQVQPTPESVAIAAPAVLDKIKELAQKRDAKELDVVLHPELAKDKAKVYDLFDTANYRGHTLGLYSLEDNRQVSVQFFQLTSSQVERVHYVYFSVLRGKVVLRDVKSGPEQADRFLRDEQKLAQSKLELMFRALNDGDETGVKKLCTDGLYQSIKDWGGDKHPGDRLTRGHRLDQVSVKTSVPLDQKSVRVVARISYPLNGTSKIEFDADFERIDNDLKIVRVRDVENKLIVFDPDMDNYLNRRYGLPDGPKPDPASLAMTEQIPLLSFRQLKEMAFRALEDRNKDRLIDLSRTIAESDPSSGLGQGFRAGANLLLGKYEEAEKDATFALEHGGTVYFVVEHHAGMLNAGMLSSDPFIQTIVGISRTKLEFRPPSGRGRPEDSDISSVKAAFDKGIPMVRVKRPFLSVSFKGSEDGRGKGYNLAALGTMCVTTGATVPQGAFSLVSIPGGDACGIPPNNPQQQTTIPIPVGPIPIPVRLPNKNGLPVYVPQNWQRDLTVVLRTIQEAQKGSGK